MIRIKRYEGRETGAALRRLLGLASEGQPYITIRTMRPNMITEGVKIDPANSTDKDGVIQLGCRSSDRWTGIRFWYWNDNGDNTGDSEITYVEY